MSTIHIYCDKHEDRVDIRALKSQPGGGWDEDPEVSHRLKAASGDSRERWILPPAWRIVTDENGKRYLRWEFVCDLDDRHICKVRQVKLDQALDMLATAGASQATLTKLAVTLEELEKLNRSGA